MNSYFLHLGFLFVFVCFLFQPQFSMGQRTFSSKAGNENEVLKRQTNADKVFPVVRRQVNNFGTAALVPPTEFGNGNHQQFHRRGVTGQPNYISAGLNYGLVGISGGVNPCTTCSSSDYSYAQKCCSFGYRQCCSVNLVFPQPVTFSTGNNGYSNSGGGYSSWRPSSSGVPGIVYDSQYNTWGQNPREKPGSCYRISYQNQGGYSQGVQGQGTGGYQSNGVPNNFGTSGGYYPITNSVQQSGHGATENRQIQNLGRYCKTDFECVSTQKCCGTVCSNPSFI